MNKRSTKTMLLASIIATSLVALQAGSSFAYNEELAEAMQNAPHVTVSPTTSQQKLIDRVETINESIERSSSDEERAALASEKDALRPALIKNGMIFAGDFHADPEYWTDTLKENGPLTAIHDNQVPPSAPGNSTDNSERDWGDHWYLVHRVYFSCGSDLVCDHGLWEYAQDGDWSSVTIEMELTSGTHIRLEHEASNLRWASLVRDFDSYWSHVRDNSMVDNDTKFTTQYWTAFEREIQDGLLTTDSGQDGDVIHSTMRIH